MIPQLSTTCLNCETPLNGSYCHSCGQKNIPKKLGIVQLVLLFFGEFFNYDGRFFRSIRLLTTQPAGLSLAYRDGKRSNYVNPIRFYLFTSAIYFLVVTFWLESPKEIPYQKNSELEINSSSVASKTPNKGSSGSIETAFATYGDYVAHQEKLPSQERTSDWERVFIRKFYEVKATYGDGRAFALALGKEVINKLPQLLLILLPCLALISKWVFYRKKDYWYFDHLVFILHSATCLFFILFLQFGVKLMANSLGLGLIEVLVPFLGVLWLGYYLLSFKNFYGKGWGATLLFFVWNSFWHGILLLIVLTLLLLLSFFTL